jgi:hypothetical protein
MQITPSLLREKMSVLGYKWITPVNIIGIRTTLQVPDVFNDFLAVIWKQEQMPAGLSLLNQQKWLNKWKYKGKNGKQLAEDNTPGANTSFALDDYNATVGSERMKIYTVTTEPGVYYQTKELLNPQGCALIKPGQYVDAYSIGNHGDKPHRALRQSGNITVYRDADRDGISEETNVMQTGSSFACNIHGANSLTRTTTIGKWSAGCQVFADWSEKEEFMDICENFRQATGNKFTYTLLREKELL